MVYLVTLISFQNHKLNILMVIFLKNIQLTFK